MATNAYDRLSILTAFVNTFLAAKRSRFNLCPCHNRVPFKEIEDKSSVSDKPG